MSNPLWNQAAKLFEAVVEMDESERSVYLDDACADDADLRSAVESLLANDNESVIETGDLHEQVSSSFNQQSIQAHIGAYRVVEQLGAGGMGLVFRAERDDAEYDQTVAIKVLQRGLDPARFRVERQILARLDHPHIARLLDGGTLEDGRPFVVMEFIEGQSIDAYCDKRRLGVPERLRLFIQLCDAVQHAHRNLVVHRDLKPNNVLIDTDGGLKLLDFGIAKLLGEDADFGVKTQTAARMMTPGYASPEQIQGQSISTASDVYSLGVVLYELLTGNRPYAAYEKDNKSFEQAVTERIPELPSRGARREGKQRLARQLRGDLDNILLKALNTDLTRRYATVPELVDDLRRYRGGLPVKARRAGVLYQMGKFVGRNRVGMVAVAVILVVGAVQQQRILLQRDVAQEQRDVAERERDVAQRERDTAAAIGEFLVGLFQVSDPAVARGEEVSARTILDQGANRVETFDQSPELKATMMSTIASVYSNLGTYDRGIALESRALELRRDVYDGDHPEISNSLNQLGVLYFNIGDYNVADPLYLEALAMRRRLHPEGSAKLAESLNNLALQRWFQGDFESGKTLYAEAIEMMRDVDREHEEYATSLEGLGMMKTRISEFDAAEPLIREALEIRRKTLGDKHRETASSFYTLGWVLFSKGDYVNAEEAYGRSRDLRRELLGDDSFELGQSLNGVAISLNYGGKIEQAEPVFYEALDVFRRSGLYENAEVSGTLNNLATLVVNKGDFAAAEPLYRDALTGMIRHLGDSHTNVAIVSTNLGRVLLSLDRPEEAIEAGQRAHTILVEALPEGHWRTLYADALISASRVRLGAPLGAEDKLQTSLTVLMEKKGVGGTQTQVVIAWLVDLYEAQGQPERAAEYRAQLL